MPLKCLNLKSGRHGWKEKNHSGEGKIEGWVRRRGALFPSRHGGEPKKRIETSYEPHWGDQQ